MMTVPCQRVRAPKPTSAEARPYCKTQLTAFRASLIAASAGLAMCVGGCGSDDGAPAVAVLRDVSSEQVSCETLASTAIAGGKVQSVATVAAGNYTPAGQTGVLNGLPAFCRVAVVMQPSPDSSVNVEVWMPRQGWNGRFLGNGGGGGGGSISYITGQVEGLKRGFAVAITDLGTAPDPNLAYDRPERWRDFGYRANHEMTVAGKTLVSAYYRTAPKKSLFQGCSTGGQQALSLAQRYPDDYDGIIAGAAANNRTHLHTMFIKNIQVLNTQGAFLSNGKLQMVTSNVIAACRGKDGGAPTDNFLTDPRRCSFDPETLPKCTATDSDTCLTAPQLAGLKAAWSGPVNPRTGELIYAAIPVGSESIPFGLASQEETISWPAQQFYMFKWALGPNWNYSTFDFDRDMDTVDARLASILNANDPDLARFKLRGGKLLMFSGTADPGVPFASAIEYYERVVQAQGGDLAATQSFFRFYLVPGMGHCSSITGGPGLGDFGQPYSPFVPPDQSRDMLLKLVDWVENKNAPDAITATRYTDATGSGVALERPICVYPKLPVYQGGDSTKAASFLCLDAARGGVPVPSQRYLN